MDGGKESRFDCGEGDGSAVGAGDADGEEAGGEEADGVEEFVAGAFEVVEGGMGTVKMAMSKSRASGEDPVSTAFPENRSSGS